MPTPNHDYADIQAQMASSSHQDEFHQHLELKMNRFQTNTHDTVSRFQMDTDREIQTIFDHFANTMQDAEHSAREKFDDFEAFLNERSHY